MSTPVVLPQEDRLRDELARSQDSHRAARQAQRLAEEASARALLAQRAAEAARVLAETHRDEADARTVEWRAVSDLLQEQAAGLQSQVAELTRLHEEVQRANDALREREELIDSLLEASTDGVIGVDRAQRCTFASRSAATMLGYTPAQLAGRDLHALIHHSHGDGSLHPAEGRAIGRAAAGGPGARVADEVFRRADGMALPVEYVVAPLPGGGAVLTFSDVTERRRGQEERARLYEEGRSAREAADRANQAKSQFLAATSHEIRTPINAIMGYADLLAAGLGGGLSDQQREYVDRVIGASRHLLGLINDVLDLSKIEAGELIVRRDESGMAGMLQPALDLVTPQAVARNLRISVDMNCPAEARYVGDPDRVRQILVNLLSNAVKFTPVDGEVHVRCRVAADSGAPAGPPSAEQWVAVEVQDTGPGIAPEDQLRIFEPFVQVDAELTRQTGGTGLGLTISRRFARLMGGDLVVRSRPGAGSCFTLWLPGGKASGVVPETASWSRTETWPSVGGVEGVAEVGQILAGEADSLAHALVLRLIDDEQVPGAAEGGEVQIADHLASFLAAIGANLASMRTDDPDPGSLLDGGDIQQVIASRHGRQRRRIGWERAELQREYRLLHDLLDGSVRLLGARRTDADLGEALGILHRLLDRAEEDALQGYDARVDAISAEGVLRGAREALEAARAAVSEASEHQKRMDALVARAEHGAPTMADVQRGARAD